MTDERMISLPDPENRSDPRFISLPASRTHGPPSGGSGDGARSGPRPRRSC